MSDEYDFSDDDTNGYLEDNWQAAQQADDDQRRRQVAECWKRIKRGEYTESDLQVIETELRAIL